jgi:hypothetical protein
MGIYVKDEGKCCDTVRGNDRYKKTQARKAGKGIL